MDAALQRLPLLVTVVLPFLLFTAWVYLALHVLVARLARRPDSPVLWFFGVVTGPLTRPVRALLPARIPEARVRVIALCVYVLAWILVRGALLQLGPGRQG